MVMQLTLVKKEEITKGLAVFKFKTEKNLEFIPGQYVTLIAEIEGRRVLRPYSIASAPYQLPEIEFFVRYVLKDNKPGLFTSKLFNAKPGKKFETLKLAGMFLLDENDKRTKIFLASGTGLGPFISMIRHEIRKYGKSNSIVVHGVSRVSDLGYRKEIEKYVKGGKLRSYIPTISRPEENKKWKGETGRVENILGKLEKILKVKITKDKYVVYACGHPNMVDTAANYYKKLGFAENKDVKFERYWSEPKKN